MFPLQGGMPVTIPYIDDVFSTYLYTGNGATQTITNNIFLSETKGTTDQQAFTIPGTYSFVVPAGVTSISVVGVGPGRSGNAAGTQGGGSLSYLNNATVTPGETLTVTVGAGDTVNDTTLARGGTTLLLAKAAASNSANIGTAFFLGGTRGAFVAAQGGNGGAGGYAGAGGAGGAGGFTDQAGSPGASGTGGSGGGGQGNGGTSGNGGGAGGGVGLLGQGSNGVGGSGFNAFSAGGPGSAGSGGSGTTYGGGGGQNGNAGQTLSPGPGGLRIIWPGTTRTFPSTNTGDVTPVGATGGGMVWIKGRSGATDHALYDTVRGAMFDLSSNQTTVQIAQTTGLTAFSTNGFSLGALAKLNTSAATYAAWSFRKAPKFFDVVTYTGNGSLNTINHNLGIAPGMIIVKPTNAVGDWYVYHTSIGNNKFLYLNSTAGVEAFGNTKWNNTTPTNTYFQVNGQGTGVNDSGTTYIAYLFAHDTAADGLIRCGTFTVSGGTSGQINLGWEPQFLLVKSSNTVQNWMVMDTSRKMALTEYSFINPNTTGAEQTGANASFAPNATGFSSTGYFTDGTVVTYLAIRRPNKPPTSGTQVYNAIARTGNSSVTALTGVGFPPDLVIDQGRSGAYWAAWWSRLVGANKALNSSSTAAESSFASSVNSFDQNGITVGTDVTQWINYTGINYINWFFKRAPGVFDMVCYTGNGTTQQISHNLGVPPELMIIKGRSFIANWGVYHTGIGIDGALFFTNAAKTPVGPDWWGNGTTRVAPTATNFTVGAAGEINTASNNTHVAYLFATKAGISKVGSYTGNGTSQTINCGFTTGARFALIKRTDSTGDWYVWDTTRGIIAANDPHLSLNTTAAEVTTNDSVDPDSTGFIVNQLAATNINVTSATYIYFAMA